jgi:Na+-driven multidrug efflux pump
MRVVAFAMVFMSVSTIWLNAVTGTGNSRYTFLIELAAIILYTIYVYTVMELENLSIVWGWMSEILYWTTLFSLSFVYIRSKKWQTKVI